MHVAITITIIIATVTTVRRIRHFEPRNDSPMTTTTAMTTTMRMAMVAAIISR